MFSILPHSDSSRTKRHSFQETKRSHQGFTLIELMITISIVAILATVGITIYSGSQRLARDTKRKADLKQIQNAISLYYQDYKRYPAYVASGSNGSCSAQAGGYTLCSSANTQPWIAGLTSDYINVLPKDPLAGSDTGDPGQSANEATAKGFGYRVYPAITTSGNTCAKGEAQVYLLYVKLENTSDPDRLGAKNYNWCGTNTPLSPDQSFSPNLFILGSYL